MTRDQLLLVQLSEECAEVSKEVAKALRFGVDEIMPGQTLTNAQRIKSEFLDLFALWMMLCHSQVCVHMNSEDDNKIDEKIERVEKYLGFSRDCGVLNDHQ